MHRRQAYGCDIMRAYIDVANERIGSLIDGALRVRPMNKPIYEPEPARISRE
jgi:adenine-specific DNA-methyltransferase